MLYPWERIDRDYEYEEVCFIAHAIFMIVTDFLYRGRILV